MVRQEFEERVRRISNKMNIRQDIIETWFKTIPDEDIPVMNELTDDEIHARLQGAMLFAGLGRAVEEYIAFCIKEIT